MGRAGDVARAEVAARPHVQDLRALRGPPLHGQRRERRGQRALGQRRRPRAVDRHVHREVARLLRQVSGHHPHELLLGHGLQGVVAAPLLADGGRGLLRDVLAAERSRAVGGIDPDLVAQLQQLSVERVVQETGHLRRARVFTAGQVGAAHVADEEGVARQHHDRIR